MVRGLIGHIIGIHHTNGSIIPVRAEKIGTHSFTLSQSHIGIPNNVGSFHGASGAQLRGLAIHQPHQKPQPSPSIIVSICSEASSALSSSSASQSTKLVSEEL